MVPSYDPLCPSLPEAAVLAACRGRVSETTFREWKRKEWIGPSHPDGPTLPLRGAPRLAYSVLDAAQIVVAAEAFCAGASGRAACGLATNEEAERAIRDILDCYAHARRVEYPSDSPRFLLFRLAPVGLPQNIADAFAPDPDDHRCLVGVTSAEFLAEDIAAVPPADDLGAAPAAAVAVDLAAALTGHVLGYLVERAWIYRATVAGTVEFVEPAEPVPHEPPEKVSTDDAG